MQVVAQAYWLTAAVALTGILHMVAVKKDLLPGLKVPLDGGRTLRGKRIFGANKTVRGVVFMTLVAAALGAAQGALFGPWAEGAGAAPMDFAATGAALGAPAAGRAAHALGYLAVAAVLGFGYALGELPNSFLKRQVDIPPGKKGRGPWGTLFFAFDQLDSVVASLLLGALLFPFGWPLVLVGTVCLSGLHLAVTGLLYLTGIKKEL